MVCSASTYNFRPKLALYQLLMVYAIKNSTYRGDFCNLEIVARRSRNQKMLDEKANVTTKCFMILRSPTEDENGGISLHPPNANFQRRARSKKNLTAKTAKNAKDVGAGFKPALLPSW